MAIAAVGLTFVLLMIVVFRLRRNADIETQIKEVKNIRLHANLD